MAQNLDPPGVEFLWSYGINSPWSNELSQDSTTERTNKDGIFKPNLSDKQKNHFLLWKSQRLKMHDIMSAVIIPILATSGKEIR